MQKDDEEGEKDGGEAQAGVGEGEGGSAQSAGEGGGGSTGLSPGQEEVEEEVPERYRPTGRPPMGFDDDEVLPAAALEAANVTEGAQPVETDMRDESGEKFELDFEQSEPEEPPIGAIEDVEGAEPGYTSDDVPEPPIGAKPTRAVQAEAYAALERQRPFYTGREPGRILVVPGWAVPYKGGLDRLWKDRFAEEHHFYISIFVHVF